MSTGTEPAVSAQDALEERLADEVNVNAQLGLASGQAQAPAASEDEEPSYYSHRQLTIRLRFEVEVNLEKPLKDQPYVRHAALDFLFFVPALSSADGSKIRKYADRQAAAQLAVLSALLSVWDRQSLLFFYIMNWYFYTNLPPLRPSSVDCGKSCRPPSVSTGDDWEHMTTDSDSDVPHFLRFTRRQGVRRRGSMGRARRQGEI